jgi:hypothetical protein
LQKFQNLLNELLLGSADTLVKAAGKREVAPQSGKFGRARWRCKRATLFQFRTHEGARRA